MGTRTRLSRSQSTGYRQLSATTRLQLTTTDTTTTISAPVKITVMPGYAGTVAVYLSDADADQIRVIGAGQVHVFDECNSPHKLWAKPSVIDGTKYLYWSVGTD